MKNLMYLKNDFVSKESFSRENSQMGLRQYLSSRVRNFLSRGAKFSCVRHFFRTNSSLRDTLFSYHSIVFYLDQSWSILFYVLVHLTMIHNLNLTLTFFWLKKTFITFLMTNRIRILNFLWLCETVLKSHSTDTKTSHYLHFDWIDFRVKEIMGCKTSYYWRSILSRMFVLLGVELLK